jgi:hypothetical protein
MFLFAPVVSNNKQCDNYQRNVLRIKSCIVFIILSFFYFIFDSCQSVLRHNSGINHCIIRISDCD